MGYSVRVDGWRYTEWYPWIGDTLAANWTALYASELYDWRGANNANLDYDLYENENVAGEAEFEGVVVELRALLQGQFQ